MPDRSKVMTHAVRDALHLQVEGWDKADNLTWYKHLCRENIKNASDGTGKQKSIWL
jgi:hypothetical protein